MLGFSPVIKSACSFVPAAFVETAGVQAADDVFANGIGVGVAFFYGQQRAHGGFGSVLLAFNAEVFDE